MLKWLNRISVAIVLNLLIVALGAMVISVCAYTLLGAMKRNQQVNEITSLTATSRDLLRATLAFRLERGVLAATLNAEGVADAASQAEVSKNRAVVEENYRTAIASMNAAADLAGIPAATARLRDLHDRIGTLRPRADDAARMAKTAREPGFVDEWSKVATEFLDSLTAATDAVDASIKFVNPRIDHLLAVKRAAWATRVALGGAAFPMQVAVASGKSLSPADIQMVNNQIGRGTHAWSIVEEGAGRPDAPRTLTTAVQRARVNFAGDYFNMRVALLTALAEGRTPAVAIADLRSQDTTNQGYLVDAAFAAVDEMVALASDEAWLATKDFIISVALMVLAFALAGVGMVVINTRVCSPVRAMTDAMRRLADHDLAVAIPSLERGDEIGAMANAVVVFRDSMATAERLAAQQAADQQAKERRTAAVEALLARFDRAVSEVLTQVGSASADLGQTAQRMSTLSGQTHEQTRLSTEAAEETSANVQAVASAAEEMSASIREISRQAIRANEIAAQAGREAAESTGTVRGLAEEATHIGEVVRLIQSIAEQTNLLALNATIEAARAGVAGKGFAVVASEVKQLANQTAKATDEISAKITGMQNATKVTVETIERIGGTIVSMADVSSTIAAAVEEQTATTAEITRNVHQAALGTQSVSSSVAGVHSAASETGEAASMVLGSAGNLSAQVQSLRHEVEAFLAGIRKA